MKKIDWKTIEERVGIILEMFPESRNIDELIVAHYADHFYKITNMMEWAIRSNELHIKANTLYRARRKYNEKGMYLPTDPDVLKRRGLMEIEYKQYAREGKPSKPKTTAKKTKRDRLASTTMSRRAV